MRQSILAFAALGAAFGASAMTGALAGAAYSTQPMRNEAACARACEDDSLCMAWRFSAGACELSAIVPAHASGAAFGLSSRAPRLSFASVSVPAAAVAEMAAAEPQTPAPEQEIDVAYALLGGPEESDLRPRLGSR
jgi:hypothetical protein